MSSSTKEIKDKLDIVEVLGSYIKIDKSGQNYKAKCPFHNEKTPSFFISPKRNSYYCFGCGAKGDIFSFVEQFEGLDFIGALKLLAERAGVKLKYEPKENQDKKERLFECMENATVIFENNLKSNNEALEYLKKRGLSEETIKNWRIGFALDDWHFLENELTKKGFKREEMLGCGVIKIGESNKIYDTFRSRIIFPIFDNAKRVIAFSGRIFGNDTDLAKYLNSPETEIFKKSEVLYGLHTAKNGIRKLGFSILVEGQMDLLMSQQSGWENTVATSGTALTNEHLKILKRLSQNIIIAYDNDPAGTKASFKAFQMALAEDFNVKAVRTPGDKDPADLILKDKSAWKNAIKEARHIVAYLWENLIEKKLAKEKFIAHFRSNVLPILSAIQSNGEKLRLINDLQMSLATGIREDHILEEVKKIKKDEQGYEKNQTNQKEISYDNATRRLFGILFALMEKTILGMDFDVFEQRLKEASEENFEKLKEQFEKEKTRLLFESEINYHDGVDKEEIEELLKNYQNDSLKEKLQLLMTKLKNAELEKNPEEIEKILKECQKIASKIEENKKIEVFQ